MLRLLAIIIASLSTCSGPSVDPNAVKLSEIVGWAKEERRAQRRWLLGTLRFAQPTKSEIKFKLMALGFTLALVLMAGLREESEMAPVPRLMRGTALNLIIAGILSMAFMGFAGLFSSA